MLISTASETEVNASVAHWERRPLWLPLRPTAKVTCCARSSPWSKIPHQRNRPIGRSTTSAQALGCSPFHGVTAAGCSQELVVIGSGRASVQRPEFRWVNTILGNLKTALRGAYHAIRPKYAQRDLSELESRFNRRFDLPDIIPRLVYVALRTATDAGTTAYVELSLSDNQISFSVRELRSVIVQ